MPFANAPPRRAWGTFDRAEALRRLERDTFDVLIVGGGITGAGAALDAASRGLRTVLVEQHDFAAGTSSRSSKLVHGGLRYLQHGEIRLVYEGLAERQVLLRNAPHLVEVLPFLIPLFGHDGLFDRRVARAFGSALWTYDLTGGLRIGRRHRRLGNKAALTFVPTLRSDDLAGAYLYHDAQADDARLTLAIVRTAALQFGAVAANGCRVVAIDDDRQGHARVRVEAQDHASPGSSPPRALDIQASVVINATGAWADEVRSLDPSDSRRGPTLRPAKGIHIALPRAKVGNHVAIVLPVPGDRRSVFVVPWGDITYVGTTDTDYDGPLDDPQCTPADVDYLLGALNAGLTPGFTSEDVVATWAGLRPLVAATGPTGLSEPSEHGSTADLSRRHQVTTSPGGVVTVTGGKLTTYRRMAADAVDRALAVIDDRPGPQRPIGAHRACRTKHLPFIGAEGSAEAARLHPHLARRYGGETPILLAMIERNPALRLDAPLVPGLPYLRAEALYAVRYEMARTLDDLLSRRTRAHLLDRDASAAAAEEVAELVAPELGWDGAEATRQVAAYRDQAAREREAAMVGAKRGSDRGAVPGSPGSPVRPVPPALPVPPESHR